MIESRLIFEEVTDDGEIARLQAQRQKALANRAWLEAHWETLLPEARGKFIAVADQEAFVADTPDRAWEWVDSAHPEDDGALVQYIQPLEGPRFYANRG
jgi:hypothetical protein